MKKIISISFVCAALFLASCGGNSNKSSSSESTETPATTPETTTGTSTPGESNVQVSNNISLTGNDQMHFNDTLFKVKAGEKITLTMKNIGTLPAAAMSHDVVVLKPGSDVMEFGKEATTARELDKMPADKKKEIIAHTKMLGPGESDQITFTLPAPGDYPFLCSFPGHYLTMHGTIIAE